jgi:hypothetical protein
VELIAAYDPHDLIGSLFCKNALANATPWGHTLAPKAHIQEAVRFVQAHPGWAYPYYWDAFQVSSLAHGWHEPEQEKEKLPIDLRPGIE